MISTNRYTFLIGAPRSGTNMLRDSIAQFRGVATWPCDEINYIWRHGNARYPSDEFPPQLATENVVGYIRRQFDKLADRTGAGTILEKTCANSLRIPFLEKVAPDARYIVIVRDGVDAVGSAQLRWKAPLDIPYLMRKARYIPVADMPYYGLRYLGNRLAKLGSKESRLSVWGPVTDEMRQWKSDYSLLQVCALQWRSCVESADSALAKIDARRVYRLQYENFVSSPAEALQGLQEFLGVSPGADDVDRMSRRISAKSVGRGRLQLSDEAIQSIMPIMHSTLKRYGYET